MEEEWQQQQQQQRQQQQSVESVEGGTRMPAWGLTNVACQERKDESADSIKG